MSHLAELWGLLFWPLLACLSMGLLHGYTGLHVLRRGVIFVDLALAQLAALGAVVALFIQTGSHLTEPATLAPPAPTAVHSAAPPRSVSDELDQALAQSGQTSAAPAQAGDEHEHETGLLTFWPTAFALAGAVLLAFSRVAGDRVPHEAIIGVIYVVAAAATVLLLSKSPHGHEQMEEMLTGKLLFVDRTEVLGTAALYAGLGLLHALFFKPFYAISTGAANHDSLRARLWDTLFYAMFAIMVTRSVAIAGVLVVFSFLIIPGACAAMLVRGFGVRILLAWFIATIVSFAGLLLSAVWDLPSGSTLVATFGAALILCAALGALWRRLRPGRPELCVAADDTPAARHAPAR